MWFEILPSFMICTVALSIPAYTLHFLHKGFLGKSFKRSQLDTWSEFYYLRDERLSGDAYKIKGLESIPDE